MKLWGLAAFVRAVAGAVEEHMENNNLGDLDLDGKTVIRWSLSEQSEDE